MSFQDVILYHYGEASDDYENELELFENLRKVCLATHKNMFEQDRTLE